MKKILSALTLSLLATTAFADDVSSHEVHVQGEVINSTCKIETSHRGGIVGVTLKGIASNIVNSNIGQPVVEGQKDFNIKLTGCPANYTRINGEQVDNFKSVVIAFDNSNVNHINKETGNLKNRFVGSTNVEVQISNADGTKVDFSKSETAISKVEQLTVNGEYNFGFKAQYIAPKEAVTAGRFASSVPFKVDYR